jgi:hypothetical protein
MNDQHLRHAIALTLVMWADPEYRRFLRAKSPGALDEEWFGWFIGVWSVARTIRAGQRESVRRYLDTVFRSAVVAGNGARAVDDAAEFIRDQDWSAQKSSTSQASLPVSLVSKVGFLLCPEKITPSDNLARRGLDRLRREAGKGKAPDRSYREYLAAFDDEFGRHREQIRKALLEPWVAVMAVNLGCPAAALSSPAVQRMTFDGYLMKIGR